jgi:hypothetical protein
MAEPKTRRSGGDVDEFLATIAEPRRAQAQTVRSLMARVTGEPGAMWGTMVGFGERDNWFVMGLAARSAALTLYGLRGAYEELEASERLGRHTTGKGCLYLRSLDGVDLGVLEALVVRAWVERGG